MAAAPLPPAPLGEQDARKTPFFSTLLGVGEIGAGEIDLLHEAMLVAVVAGLRASLLLAAALCSGVLP